MKLVSKAAAAALAVSVLAVAGGASASIVCNGRGDCWHTHEAYTYKPAWGLTVHEDNWAWGAHDKYRWREHDGRGYWRGSRWVGF
jgi:hypothetical protein